MRILSFALISLPLARTSLSRSPTSFRRNSVRSLKIRIKSTVPDIMSEQLPEESFSLLSAEQAVELLNKKSVKFLDGSWHMNKARDPSAEFMTERIPGAQRFDIDEISDKANPLPHMLPSNVDFAARIASLGVSRSDHVVIYTTSDCFSAARVWWTFRTFNHQRVSILNGGLNAWKLAGGSVESGPVEAPHPGDYPLATVNKKMIANVNEVVSVMESGSAQILDARSQARFLAQVPEPRPGLEGGHIPGSLNLPFNMLLQDNDPTKFKSPAEIRDAFVDSGIIFGSKVYLTCGSGVTAAVLCMGMHLIGKDIENFPIYDGSWSEWGARSDLPKMRP